MSKATIDAVKEAEARADAIKAEAEAKAKKLVADAEQKGRAMLESREAEAEAEYSAKIDEVTEKTALIVEAQRKKATGESKLLAVEAERRMSEAKRLIIRRIGEICQ